ncbi:major facilitator superfamily domain-containing protein [Xylariaceae sp. FL1019]|nr:major facilitator superfamily domain-containing protein [Xylariaceae sp. FL1019]
MSSSPARRRDCDNGTSHSNRDSFEATGTRASEDNGTSSRDALLSQDPFTASSIASLPPLPDTNLRAPARRHIKLKIAAATYSFFLVGFIPSAIGVIIPHLEEHYSLGDAVVSLIFVCSPLGYIAAAFTNSFIHLNWGQRGIAFFASLCAIIFTLVACFHPPYPVFLLFAVLYYYGAGLLDGSWSAWAGGMKNANIVQGILHSGLSIGASIGPILAGALIELGKNPWYKWYYVLAPLTVIEAAVLLWAFWYDDGDTYRSQYHDSRNDDGEDVEISKWAPFKHLVTWICGVYFLSYVGSEASINGWIVTFMRRVREADPYLASLSSSFFWIGVTLGRITLGYITDRAGVRIATTVYIVLAIILQAIFAFISSSTLSAIVILLIGYFFGPLFPSGLVMLTRSLNRSLHVRAVAIAVTFGQIGGALIPSGLGALSEMVGMKVFQAVIFAWLLVTLAFWCSFPSLPPEDGERYKRVRSEDENARRRTSEEEETPMTA